MRVPNFLLRESLAIDDLAGSGARGPVYIARALPVRASVQQTSRLAVDNRGRTVTIEVLVIIRPEAGPVAPESKVTWAGTVYRVIAGYPMPDSRRPSYYELTLARYASA